MLEHPTLAVAVIRHGRIAETNGPWRTLFAWPADVSSESHVATLFANVASADRFERAMQAAWSSDPDRSLSARAEHTLVRRDASAFLAEVVVSLAKAEDAERPLGGDAIWQVRDISVERTLRRELRDLEDYHRELSRHQWDMTFVIDRKGRVSYASSSIEGVLGYRVHAMLGQPFAALLEPGHAQAAERWLRSATNSRRSRDGTDAEGKDGFMLRVLHSDGAVRVLACRPRDCFDVPRIAGMVVHARDVTDASEEPVVHARSTPGEPRPLATDALTGLPGRIAAERHIAEAVAEAGAKAGVGESDAGSVTVLFIDLDHLQDVNDGDGLMRGDAVIARAARVLERTAGAGSFVARVDGDEFVIVVRRTDAADADAMAQAVLDALDEATDANGDDLSTRASIGIARCPDDAGDGPTLLLHADLAMREAKARGRGRTVAFNARLAAGLQLRKALDAEIEAALQNDEFVMFYQPQIALASGKVVGLEALLRWQHPTRGMLLPDAFLGAAFKRGLIDAVTKTALVQVCSQIAAWRKLTNMPELPVAVNVSGRQFHDRRLPALVASALLKSGLPARLLVLEITEQNLVGDDDAVQRVVKELSRLGVRIAIGDFNVGHAAFGALRQLGVTQIKLDAGCIREHADDTESAVVVAAIIDLARRLKYQVVVERVETREQHDLLLAAGCEVGQGFYFGAPLSTDEIVSYLHTQQSGPGH